jgi:hypothetical protein
MQFMFRFGFYEVNARLIVLSLLHCSYPSLIASEALLHLGDIQRILALNDY